MTELLAIIRRQRASATRQELHRAGCPGYTVFPVLGRGRQRGIRTVNGSSGGHGFLPRMAFSMVVDDEQVPEMVEALVRANQTGEFGDGRIFLTTVETTGRISEGPAS